MPFKSQAQRRKFAALLLRGDITPEQYERWNRETGGAKLPERVKRKGKSIRKRKPTSRARKSNVRPKRRRRRRSR